MGILDKLFGGKKPEELEEEFKTPGQRTKETLESLEKYAAERLAKMSPEERKKFEEGRKVVPPPKPDTWGRK